MSNKQKSYQSYQQEFSYGHKILKGISSDQILKLINLHPLLTKYYKQNDLTTQQRIIDTLMREPSNSDCPGFIYGFRNKQQYQNDPMPNKYDIKLGRTKRQVPQQRIYEWQRDDHHEYVQIFTVRSQHNNKLQSLVHLFFAYARKTKYIDGKRRIEWFSFNQKTLTAATVNLIDSTMQKVHEMAKINQVQKVQLDYNLSNWLKSVQNKIQSVVQLKRRLLLFGFKKNGKTILKSMLLSSELTCTQKTKNLYQIQSSNKKETEQTTILQIQFGVEKENQKKLILSHMTEAFEFWSTVYSTLHLTSCLIIRQADLLSSDMIGVRQSIRNYKKHLYESALPQNLIIVVTHCDPDFGQKDVQQILKQNNQFLSSEDDEYIKKGKYFFISKPASTGKFKYNISSLIQQIEANQNYLSFEFKSPLLKDICQKTIHYSYQDVAQSYQVAAKKRFAQIEQELKQDGVSYQEQQGKIVDSKLAYLLKLRQYVKNLKQQKTQVQIFKFMKFLNIQLKLSQEAGVSSQFYVFCECIAKNNLNFTIVFSDIQEELNKQQIWIRDTCNNRIQKKKMQLAALIKTFYQEIKDEQTFKKVVNLLTSICEEVQFQNVIQKLIQLNEFQKIGNLIQIIQFLFKIKEIEASGINIVNLHARINEAIFLGTKNRKAIKIEKPEQKEKNQQKQIKQIKQIKPKKQSKKIQPPKQSHKIDQFIKKKQKKNQPKEVIVIDSDQSNSQNQSKEKDQVERYQNQSNTQQQSSTQQSMIDFHSPNLNQMLIQFSKSKQAQQKQFVFNSCEGQFLINIEEANLLQETIIFAKSIKIVQDINFNFLGNNKKRLIMVSQKYEGVNRIKINNQKNGSGCLLLLKDRKKKQFIALDDYHAKNNDKLAKLLPKKFIDWYCLKIK